MNIHPLQHQQNLSLDLMNKRLGSLAIPPVYYKDTVDNANLMAEQLNVRGGYPQQERMIRDKRRALDHATKYSYQAVRIKKAQDGKDIDKDCMNMPTVRALINPDKVKMDYDQKILSVRFDHDFQPGDIFEWSRTGSYWIILTQDVDEVAYFRATIRRCSYQIRWIDEDGEEHAIYCAVRGPVETKIDDYDRHNILFNDPNYSLDIYMPKNPLTMNRFKRYDKFYLAGADDPDDKICWRVEATDSISTPGILEIQATEYFSNNTQDDVDNGLVGVLITPEEDPNPSTERKVIFISGETFIKPSKVYEYTIGIPSAQKWEVDKKYPVKLEPFTNEKGYSCVKVKWLSPYSGEFELRIGNYNKTIVVESLI